MPFLTRFHQAAPKDGTNHLSVLSVPMTLEEMVHGTRWPGVRAVRKCFMGGAWGNGSSLCELAIWDQGARTVARLFLRSLQRKFLPCWYDFLLYTCAAVPQIAPPDFKLGLLIHIVICFSPCYQSCLFRKHAGREK